MFQTELLVSFFITSSIVNLLSSFRWWFELSLPEDKYVLMHDVGSIICWERPLYCYSESVEAPGYLIPDNLFMEIPLAAGLAQTFSQKMRKRYHAPV